MEQVLPNEQLMLDEVFYNAVNGRPQYMAVSYMLRTVPEANRTKLVAAEDVSDACLASGTCVAT